MSEPKTAGGRFFSDNSLSLTLFALFAICLGGHAATGLSAYNAALVASHLSPVSFKAYLRTGNFLDGAFRTGRPRSCNCWC